MRPVWKVVLTLALVLPMVAYVAGSLAASRPDDPGPRETVFIRHDPTTSPSDRSRPDGRAAPPKQQGDRRGDDDRDDDRDDEQDDVDDNGVRVVSPRPTPLGEDSDDDDEQDDRADDRADDDDRDDSADEGGDDGAGESRDD